MKTKKIKTSSLIIGIVVILIFSLIMGVTAGSMGLGSRYPQLNLIVKPLVCPHGQMSYTQQVSEIGPATYWTSTWACVDEQSGAKKELDSDTVFLLAGPIYGLAVFIILLIIVYLYWNSSIGPAKNDGLRLW